MADVMSVVSGGTYRGRHRQGSQATDRGHRFPQYVVGGPARAVVWGKSIDPATLEERIRFCVWLFLNGARPR
jgi:hypothetical protein